jgi:hypothetical protein
MDPKTFEALNQWAESEAKKRSRGNWIRTNVSSLARSAMYGGQSKAVQIGVKAGKAMAFAVPAAIAPVVPVAIVAAIVARPVVNFIASNLVSVGTELAWDKAVEGQEFLKDTIGTIDRNITKLNNAGKEFVKKHGEFANEAIKKSRDAGKFEASASAALREYHECRHYVNKLQTLLGKLKAATEKLQKELDAADKVAATDLQCLKNCALVPG